MWWVTVVVVGFSLDKSQSATREPVLVEGRRAQETVVELCKSSCDSGEDAECDEMDSTGAYTRSCDMHPTTSCDSECTFPAAPPALPYTIPPPPPPKPSATLFGVGLALFILSVLLLAFALAWNDWRSAGQGSEARRSFSYWCCCLVPCMRWMSRANSPSPEIENFEIRAPAWSPTRPPDNPTMPGLMQLAL